ncbi:MAG: Hsp70 family protein, partial [Clostridia bacterium]|nr:Hsp70 family protein [Clostridia bacterium]
PQIEVTFDIDANGIVHVSAKDLGTGKAQQITITASTNLSEDDIQKAVDEAERYAEEDKKRKEEVDARNQADNLIYTTEKSLKDFGDKVTPDEKTEIEAEIEKVKKALEGSNTEEIKTACEKLTEVSYKSFGRIYQEETQAQNAQAQSAGGNSDNPDDGVVDADFEEVK